MIREIIRERAEQIRKMIEIAEMDRATMLLIDFAVDFATDREQRNEATRIRGLYSQMKVDERSYARMDDLARQRSLLISGMLELSDRIEESFLKEQGKNEPVTTGRWKESRPVAEEADNPSITSSDVIFRCENMTKRFGKNFTLEPLSFEMKAGEITALVGVNGSGKSTLLNLIACETMADEGNLYYPEFAFESGDWHHFKRNIGLIPHKIAPWGARLATYLKYTFAVNGIRGQENLDLVNQIFKRLDLESYADRFFRELSAGYQLRSALAVLLGIRPKLIILDEPLANLDVKAQEVFLNDISAVARSYKFPAAIIISSQHLFEIEGIADNIILLDKGKVVFCGPKEGLEEHGTWRTFELACRSTLETVREALQRSGITHKIELFGNVYIIEASKLHAPGDLLKALLQHNIEPDYFRNISSSTKKYMIKRDA